MPNPAIELDRIGKAYPIGVQPPAHANLVQSVLAAFLNRPVRRPEPSDRFWAVRDVSFTVGQGEVVGLIGRNGAGKSTLLKVLSRVTGPTLGRARVAGRVAAALDAKIDFDPELTGRENVYLRAAAVGLTSSETRRRYDELVAFSGIEKFLATPMKRYGLGMTVRMSMAIATHLPAEVVLVDELLSFGDVQFRDQCQAKLRRMAVEDGRAVLFVSHDMAAVRQLCHRAVLLRGGRVEADGPVDAVVDQYEIQSTATGAGATLAAGGYSGTRLPSNTSIVTAREFISRAGELLERTERGEAFVIDRDGRPTAQLVPIRPGA